jgi:hypothetical protein
MSDDEPVLKPSPGASRGPFEPSELIEYGLVGDLTQSGANVTHNLDGGGGGGAYTS